MCGIAARCSQNQADVCAQLLDGIGVLSNRGYDSAGVAWLEAGGDHVAFRKTAQVQAPAKTLVETLRQAGPLSGFSGVAHTRWASHGAKVTENAHPHLTPDHKWAVVHNGIIENYQELKQRFGCEYPFRSHTDTEVVCLLLHVAERDLHLEPEAAWAWAVGQLEGTWALTAVCSELPFSLLCACYGSPLLLSFGAGELFAASESAAFARYAQKWVPVAEGDVLRLHLDAGGRAWMRTLRGQALTPHTTPADQYLPESQHHVEHTVSAFPDTPAPYSSWTAREIALQDDSLEQALHLGGRLDGPSRVKLGGLDREKKYLLPATHLVLVGCGSSRHAAEFTVSHFRALSGFSTVQVFDAAEFVPLQDLPREGRSVVVFVSQSGETRDCMRVLRLLGPEVGTLGITNTVHSSLARETQCGVYLNVGREVGVASTKCFTASVQVLLLVAVWFAQERSRAERGRRQLLAEILQLPSLFRHYQERWPAVVQRLRPFLLRRSSVFVLGRGIGFALAQEAALKLKELSGLHCEAYSTASLKHGPYAVLQDHTPVVLHAWDGPTLRLSWTTAAELHSRNACVLLITNSTDPAPEGVPDECVVRIRHAPSPWVASLVAVLLHQHLSLELANALNLNPDQPRHLAKSVTVD